MSILNISFSPKDMVKLETAKQYVDLNYSTAISPIFLAKHVELHLRKFNVGFKGFTGKTLHEYLIHVRIDHAKDKLPDFSKDINKIAKECGFSRPSLFNFHFKAIIGKTPTEYRRRWMVGVPR